MELCFSVFSVFLTALYNKHEKSNKRLTIPVAVRTSGLRVTGG